MARKPFGTGAHLTIDRSSGEGDSGEQSQLPEWLEYLQAGKQPDKLPFILTLNLPPVLGKLVRKKQALEFISM